MTIDEFRAQMDPDELEAMAKREARLHAAGQRHPIPPGMMCVKYAIDSRGEPVGQIQVSYPRKRKEAGYG